MYDSYTNSPILYVHYIIDLFKKWKKNSILAIKEYSSRFQIGTNTVAVSR